MDRLGDALYLRVLEEVVAAVRAGDFAAGAELGSENNLARQFKVSRSVIQDALRILRHYGLIVGPGGGRTRVAVEPMRSMALAALELTRTVRAQNQPPPTQVVPPPVD